MRSRTELVTHQLEGSDFEDESDFEDSEEDWRPAKGEQVSKHGTVVHMWCSVEIKYILET